MNLYVNLDFEYEYLRRERPSSKAVRRQNERWSHIMRLLPGWRDAEPRGERHDGPWMPWGVSPSFMALEPAGDFTSCEIVERVNSKAYSASLEKELSIALPGACVATSVAAVEAAVGGLEESLVKNPWGVAGRERISVESGSLDDEARRWIERQMRLVQVLLVEPRVDRHRDWSIQFDLGDEVRKLGACHLVTDHAGNHRGHRVRGQQPPEAITASALAAAERVFDEGYRGPLGVDAFEGSLAGIEVVRPICELNARMTFGRLAMELSPHVDQPFVWWHPPTTRQVREHPPIQPGAAAGIYRLPDFADPNGKSQTVVVIGDDTPWAS